MPPAALKRCKHLRKDNQNPSPQKGGGFFIGNGSGQPQLNRNDHPFIYIACRAIAALILKFSHNRLFYRHTVWRKGSQRMFVRVS